MRTQQWVRVGVYGMTLIVNFLLFFIGVKYYGPLRSILSYDYADLILSVLFDVVRKGSKGVAKSNKLKGAGLVCLAYFILYLGDLYTKVTFDSKTSEFVASPVSESNPEETFDFGIVSIHVSHVGGICLFLAVLTSVLRRSLGKIFATEVGGSKRLYSLSMISAAIMLSPFAMFSSFTTEYSIFTSGILLRVLATILFPMVIDFYAESFSQAPGTGSLSIPTNLSLGASFLVVVLSDWSELSNSPFIVFSSFLLLVFGMNLIFSRGGGKSALPSYGGDKVSNFSLGGFLKSSFKSILSDHASRRIFLFLLLNLSFMFVEMVYGLWTNSLSLISDACHMLFDSTALVIGLFASIISKWAANKKYSYGYGRVEVLSGFINGIFLVFIAFVVLLESMERFFSPQEVNTDSLLTVSVMGLLVNLVGVVAFHDLHGGGDHGHSHSHGHSHGHSHNHSDSKKEKKEKKEKKGHGHSHGHDHNDHGHSHGHSDDHHDEHKHDDHNGHSHHDDKHHHEDHHEEETRPQNQQTIQNEQNSRRTVTKGSFLHDQ
eukprot:TRINITY_DN1878_c0_g1_i2.p1 TRINITY_DN1878_c0_g1~~TRINITY_DN1878_c0_g1_i2.p1  ORF type:complete len:627 (+),score=172.01 TRINITY_DN1878_c0_g1_i2:251-1882(+)